MKQAAFILVFFFFSWSGLHSQSLKKALFLGNSYTYVNDLPLLVSQIASSKGDSLFALKYTPGGYTFQMHSEDPMTRAAIAAGPWDLVILQEQSQLPALWPDSVAVTTYPFADTLNRLIKENDSCSLTLFFMTWGRKYGDTDFCPVYPPVCTYNGMQARLRESYLTMGTMFNAEVSPVGAAWKTTRTMNPGLELYQSDNSHPSLCGSYLAACTFYAAIFHKSPVGAFVPAGIAQTTADSLQLIAFHTVLDSLNTWFIDTTTVKAGFSYNPVSSFCFRFSNQSWNAQQYYWDFGDGSHTTLSSPQHCYSTQGTYTVKLRAENICMSDSISMNILVNPSAVSETDPQDLPIRPNPTKGIISPLQPVQAISDEAVFCIYSTTGERVMQGRYTTGNTINVSQLPDGIYHLILNDNKRSTSGRFLLMK
ncbi:MAG: PKD domain-containing protein [Bacteroidota bacterium]